MAGEDEIVVMVDDTPEPGGDHIVLVDETGITAGTVKKVSDDPVATLKSQLAEKQAALDSANQQLTTVTTAASQRVRQAEQDATEARTQATQSQRTTVDSGIAAAKAEADAAEEAYKAAFEAGDAGAVAKAQRRISRAETDMAMLEQAKGDLAAEPAPRKEVQRTEAPRAAEDPIEAFIQSRTAPTQSWLRTHRDYLTDPKKNAKMQAAHFDAESEGIALDSPQYFDHIERFLGMKKADGADAGQQQQSQRRPTAPVAPVTNSGGGMSGEGQSVRLTKGEAEAATDGVTHVWNWDDPTGKGRFKKGDAIGLVEMAKRKLALTKSGRYLNGNIDGT